jgi:hypothetical protein
VHFLRDLRGHVRRDQHDALGAVIRSIFTARDGEEARRRLRDAVGQLERRLRKIAAVLEEAEADVLAFYAFPAEHWPKLRSTDESVKGRGPGWRRFAGVQSIGGRSRRGADRRIWPRFGVDRPGSGRSRACGGVAVGRGAFGAAVSGR